MYKVMHWYKSLVGEKGIAKIEHYFTDSKKALEYYYNTRKVLENVVLVVATEHTEFVFMSHYSDDFPIELRPDVFRVSVKDVVDTPRKYMEYMSMDVDVISEIESKDKTVCMYDLFEKECGFTRRKFKFNKDGSVEEI